MVGKCSLNILSQDGQFNLGAVMTTRAEAIKDKEKVLLNPTFKGLVRVEFWEKA